MVAVQIEQGSDIGKVLKDLREARGLSRAELADKLGNTPGYVAMYENGTRKPGVGVLIRFGDALGVSIQLVPHSE